MNGRAGRALGAAALLAASPLLCAGQLDLHTFSLLRPGMSEGEVLMRTGPPDAVTAPGDVLDIHARTGVVTRDGVPGVETRRHVRESVVKEFHYVPGPYEHDPHLTVIVIRSGLVWDLRRTKVLTRQWPPQDRVRGGRDAGVPAIELRRRQAEETLRAARDYAETRARLLERGAVPPAPATGVYWSRGRSPPPAVYRVEQPDGSVYFGDRPPAR